MSGEVRERGTGRRENRACGFPGHLRVRKASAEEKPGLAGLFAGSDTAGWVEETLATGRAQALVIERFAEKAWMPLGFTVTDAGGDTALAIYPEARGRGLAHEALRAAVRVLREEAIAELSAGIKPDDRRSARAFEKAGFAPAGSCRLRGRPSTRYVRNLRGDCTPYNVWI